MDVQAKINCSLDDLIKFQRKAARGPAVNGAAATPPKKAAPQRVNNKIGINKKAQNIGRQQPYLQRPQQQHQGSFTRQHQQQRQPAKQQQHRTPTVADKINLPLDAMIAKQKRQQQQNAKQQQQQQQLRKRGGFAVGRKQRGSIRRRGAFVASRDDQRRGRLDAATAAALAVRSAAARSAAAKAISAARPRGGRQRTARQQVVETLKSAAAFKPSAGAQLKRRSSPFINERAKASLAAPGGRRLANGRLALRRQSLAGAALAGASRTNTSLARRRPLGPPAARRNANPGQQTARSSSSYPQRKGYTTSSPVATRPVPIDRRRPPSPTSTAAPSFAADPEMLSNIKIMATLDTVPPPLPQQRGAHVAVPAAMQQQQHQEQQPPRAAAVTVADSETLSSRFGY